MTWKKSKDGGFDFITEEQIKEEPKNNFNFSACTSIDSIITDLPLPVPPRNGARERLNEIRKRKYGR